MVLLPVLGPKGAWHVLQMRPSGVEGKYWNSGLGVDDMAMEWTAGEGTAGRQQGNDGGSGTVWLMRV